MLSDWGKMSLYFFVVGALSRYEWDLFNKFTQQFTHSTTHLSADVYFTLHMWKVLRKNDGAQIINLKTLWDL